jgi:hypothetical protein
MLVVVLMVLVGILAAIVVGPGRVIDWLGAYLILVLMVLGVIVGVFGFAAWEIARLHDEHKQPWSATFGKICIPRTPRVNRRKKEPVVAIGRWRSWPSRRGPPCLDSRP